VTLYRRLAVLSTLATLILIAIGGLVRATKSGLGCGTDWPDCGGHLVPSLATRATTIEFSHRFAASVVVFLLASLALVAFLRRREDPRLLWPSIAAFLLVMSQALIGALVVKLELDASSVILHLGTALSLLALLIFLSGVSLARTGRISEPANADLNRQAKIAAGSVFLLLLVGSYVSGRGAGLVFPDWPLMDGRVIPELGADLQVIHFLHRALAAVVGGILVWSMIKILRRKESNPLAAKLIHAAIGLFAIEVVIGAINVWTELNSVAVTLHLATGALIWASLVAAAVVTSPSLATVAEESSSSRARSALGREAQA
jgi:cytochrome c oxidase assembly protein subunit 15